LNNIYNTPRGKKLATGRKKKLLEQIEKYSNKEAKTIFETSIDSGVKG